MNEQRLIDAGFQFEVIDLPDGVLIKFEDCLSIAAPSREEACARIVQLVFESV